MSRLALVLLFLSACAPAAPDPAPAPAAPAAAAAPAAPAAPAAADPIMGEYTVTITDADVPAVVPDSMKAGIVGTWNIAFHGGGHSVVSHNGQEVAQVPYVVSGNQLTHTANDTGPYACHEVGTYTWQLNGNQLTLTRVQDPCEGRAFVLTRRPLTRRG